MITIDEPYSEQTVPTIAEPVRHCSGSNLVSVSLASVVADLADYGIRPTPLAVLVRAIDLDMPEDRAVALAAEARAVGLAS